MAGVLGFEPRKCQIQSLMPYRLGYTPMCLFIIHDLCFFDKCFLCKTLVFLRFRQDRKYRKEMLEINVFFTLGCQNNR